MAEKLKVDHSRISGVPPNSGAEKIVEHFTKGAALSGKIMDRVTEVVSAEQTAKPTAAAPSPAVVSPLASIRKGKDIAPPRIFLYGTEGIGKSTLASQAPKTVFIDLENGLERIDCERFPKAASFRQAKEQLSALASEVHSYGTVAVDSADWLEKLIFAEVCAAKGKSSIEDIGFAKGYVHALEYWREILALLDRCRDRGMAIILIAHSKVEKFEDPETATYDRYSPRLHKHATALLTEWVDAVLFATRKFVLRKEGEGTSERRIAQPLGADGGERVLRTVGSAACVAKNRYSLPAELPMSWMDLETHLVKGM